MNIPAYLIITSIVILAILGIFSIGVTETVPLYVRNEFDNICNNYSKTLSIQGYLSETDKNNLSDELNNINLKDVEISNVSKKEWGSDIDFIVKTNYEYESLDLKNFKKETIKKPLTYKNKVKVFGLDN